MMMMIRVFIQFSLIIIVITTTVFANTEEIESNFYREDTCANISGYCVLENECPHSVGIKHNSLCPSQSKDGAICCKNFPSDKVNCFQLHNDCMDKCPNKNLDLGRKGCSTGKSCCVLL